MGIKTEWLIRWLLQTVLWVSGAIKIEWLNPFGHRMLVNGFIRKSAISNAVEQIVPAGV